MEIGKIVIVILGIVLVWYTFFAQKTTKRLRKEQRDDFRSYNPRLDSAGFRGRTKRRENEAKDTWAFQDLLCWIFWIALIVIGSQVF